MDSVIPSVNRDKCLYNCHIERTLRKVPRCPPMFRPKEEEKGRYWDFKQTNNKRQDEWAKRRAKPKSRTFVTHALIFVSFCYIRAFLDAGERLVTDSTCQPIPACHPGLDRWVARGQGTGPPASCWVWEWARGPASLPHSAGFAPTGCMALARRGESCESRTFASCPAGLGKTAYLLCGASRPLACRPGSAVQARRAGAGLQGGTRRDVNTLSTHRRCRSPEQWRGTGDSGLVWGIISFVTTSRRVRKEAVGGSGIRPSLQSPAYNCKVIVSCNFLRDSSEGFISRVIGFGLQPVKSNPKVSKLH